MLTVISWIRTRDREKSTFIVYTATKPLQGRKRRSKMLCQRDNRRYDSSLVSAAPCFPAFTHNRPSGCGLGKGKHSEDGPKILPALQKYITEWVTSQINLYILGSNLCWYILRRGLESELDPDNDGVLIVHLPRQES